MSRLVLAVAASGVIVLAACNGSVPEAHEVRQQATSELTVGSSDASDVEAFYRRHGISFTWTKVTQTYYGSIRPPKDYVVHIDFAMKSDGKLSSVSVYVGQTGTL